jgi:hypothetical protein
LVVLVRHQQLPEPLCTTLVAAAAVGLLEIRLALAALAVVAMAPQQLERLAVQAQAAVVALMPMVAQVLLSFHPQLKLLRPLAVQESHGQDLTTFTHLPHLARLHSNRKHHGSFCKSY